MSFDPISVAFSLGESLITRIWPDPMKRAEELRKLEEIRQTGDIAQLNAHVQLMMGQLEINKMEAEHGSVFVAGWRPWIGWVGGVAMAYQFVMYPLMLWVWAIANVKGVIPDGVTPPPVLDTGALFAIVTGMLGVAASRSYDKTKGTQSTQVGK